MGVLRTSSPRPMGKEGKLSPAMQVRQHLPPPLKGRGKLQARDWHSMGLGGAQDKFPPSHGKAEPSHGGRAAFLGGGRRQSPFLGRGKLQPRVLSGVGGTQGKLGQHLRTSPHLRKEEGGGTAFGQRQKHLLFLGAPLFPPSRKAASLPVEGRRWWHPSVAALPSRPTTEAARSATCHIALVTRDQGKARPGVVVGRHQGVSRRFAGGKPVETRPRACPGAPRECKAEGKGVSELRQRRPACESRAAAGASVSSSSSRTASSGSSRWTAPFAHQGLPAELEASWASSGASAAADAGGGGGRRSRWLPGGVVLCGVRLHLFCYRLLLAAYDFSFFFSLI